MGKYSDLPRLARELVDLKVDAIFATCGVCTEAARRATHTFPIVTVSGDPTGHGAGNKFSNLGGDRLDLAQIRRQGQP